jgi:hypothetical protein
MVLEAEYCSQDVIDPSWPSEVGLILTALEAGHWGEDERRKLPRFNYRVKALLRLFADTPGSGERVLYTRNANCRGLAFLTPHRLPLGYGGSVEIATPTGKIITVACTLLRCREVASGWFEGTLYFNRDQNDFAVASANEY